ncbi:hypothetical protein Tco_1010825 [Tanacetum coccineum]
MVSQIRERCYLQGLGWLLIGRLLLREVAERINMLTGMMDPATASLSRMATRVLKNPSLEIHTPSVQVSHVDDFRVRLSLMTSMDYNEDDSSSFGIDSDQANVVSNYATTKGMFNMSIELNTCSMRTYDDVVSSSLHLLSVSGTANIADLFGVPLNTPWDNDKLTKDIEWGKYEMWSDLHSDKHTEVMDTICAMWHAFVAGNPNVTSAYSSDLGKSEPLESRVKGSTNVDDTIHVDESPIVQSVIVQDMPNSYVGAAGGLKLVPSKSKANFRSLFLENLCEGANFSIPRKVVETVSTRFANTLYGYFIGKRMAIPVVEYYIRKNWANMVSVPPTDVTHNAVTPTIEKANDGFQTVGKKIKNGKSKSTNGGHLVKQTIRYELKASTSIPKKGATNLGNASKSSSMLKNQPLKVTIPSTKEGNITMSNSYAAVDDESDEDVENVYDESANLLHSLKTGGSSSTFTVAAG